MVDVFVGQVGHLLVLPAGHRQNRLDDDAAVGGNAGQLVNQQVVLLHELLLGHQGDGVDTEGNHQTVRLPLFDRLLDGEPVAVGTQLDERVVADGLLGAAVDGEHLFRWKQLVGQQTVGAAVADEGGFTQVILGVDLVDVGSRFGCGALLGLCPLTSPSSGSARRISSLERPCEAKLQPDSSRIQAVQAASSAVEYFLQNNDEPFFSGLDALPGQ